MGLTKEQITQIREELDTCKKPLIFFHDDPDGVSSFLLFYRYMREGKGVIIKTTPKIDERFLRQVQEYGPDKIFVLDIAMVEQEFIDQVNTKIIWIDHHTPLKRQNILYFNPRAKDPKDQSLNVPTSYLCYQVVKQDLWIAMIGIVGDWHYPDIAEEFKKQYPDMLAKEIKDPESALFESKLGNLIEMVSFSLKGSTQDAMKCVKILTRINSPYEITKQETPGGKYLYKKYSEMKKEYQAMLNTAIKQKPIGKLLVFRYPSGSTSFTKDLANELLHRFPEYVIIIAREKDDELKMSLRSKTAVILPILLKVFEQVDGHGGGHEMACGANVKAAEFDKFLELFAKEL